MDSDRISGVICWACLAAAIVLVALPTWFAAPPAPQVQIIQAEPVRERVLDLPEDGDVWQFVQVYGDRTRTGPSQKLAAQVATTPRLQSLLAQTKHYEFGPDHWWVKQHLPGIKAPAVLLQTGDGRVVYKAGGDNLPPDGEVLADEIAQRISECCPDDKPLERRPDGRRIIPDLRPEGPARDDSPLFTLVLLLASGAAGLYTRRQQS